MVASVTTQIAWDKVVAAIVKAEQCLGQNLPLCLPEAAVRLLVLVSLP